MKTIKTIIVAVVALAPLPALAQQYQKVEGQVRENIPAGPFLAAAYAFMWVAVLVYVGLVARRLGRVQGEVEELRRRINTR
jgi:CcmD family protein